MANDKLALVGAEAAEVSNCTVEKRALERPAEPLPALRQLNCPPLRLVGDATVGRRTRGAAPELLQQAGGDLVCLLLVGNPPELRPRFAPLHEEGPSLAIVGQERDGPLPVPVLERVSLEFGLEIGDVDLEYGRSGVQELGRRHEGDVGVRVHRPEREIRSHCSTHSSTSRGRRSTQPVSSGRSRQ